MLVVGSWGRRVCSETGLRPGRVSGKNLPPNASETGKAMTPDNAHTARLRAPSAVLIGAAVGFALSYTVLFVLGLMFLWVLVWLGVPGNESYAEAHRHPAYLAFAHLVGFLCLMEGGRWVSRLSHQLHLRNAAMAGMAMVVITALGNLVPYDMPIPFWSRIASVALPIPAFVWGALLERRAS